MQARLHCRALCLARHRVVPVAIARTRCNSSFIKQVMEQVKRDMESDAKLKKDWEAVQKSSERMAKVSAESEEKFSNLAGKLKSKSSTTADTLRQFRDAMKESAEGASQKLNETTQQNETLKQANEMFAKYYDSAATGSGIVFAKAKGVFTGAMDKTSTALGYVGDEHAKAEKLKAWQQSREHLRQSAAAKAAAEAAPEGHSGQEAAPPQPEPETAMVVSKAHGSSWERFGAGVRDMPFLNNVFHNPFFERMMGESEIAASIREMKEIDPYFQLEDFSEDIEYVIAPHVVKNYLEGNDKSLEVHCGEAAFAAVNASIKARHQQKLTLDTSVLAGPKEVELKGAKLMEAGPPCFIWTFNTQQVNCLRDVEGDIIEGAVDDIRTVHYAMVVTRHPELEKAELEYPWQISELAIVGNQPCW